MRRDDSQALASGRFGYTRLQRDACRSYIESQCAPGWVSVPRPTAPRWIDSLLMFSRARLSPGGCCVDRGDSQLRVQVRSISGTPLMDPTHVFDSLYTERGYSVQECVRYDQGRVYQ